MYTDGFVKKRQLNMSVAHFMSPVAEGSGYNNSYSASDKDDTGSECSA